MQGVDLLEEKERGRGQKMNEVALVSRNSEPPEEERTLSEEA